MSTIADIDTVEQGSAAARRIVREYLYSGCENKKSNKIGASEPKSYAPFVELHEPLVEFHETFREPLIATIELLPTSFVALHALFVEFHELSREPYAAPVEPVREPSADLRDTSCSERKNLVSMACTADDTRLATEFARTGFVLIHVESSPELLWIAMEDLLSLLFLFLFSIADVVGATVCLGK